MSKSLGNFITIHDLLETEKFGGRTWPGEVLRLAMLMTHYREPIDFTVKRLEEAEDKLRGWQRAAAAAKGTGVPDASVIEALSDDLNFHRAAVAIDVIARKANRGVETAVECLAATLAFFGFPQRSLLADPVVFDTTPHRRRGRRCGSRRSTPGTSARPMKSAPPSSPRASS